MSEFTDSDFEALEAAVMETPRGRWFLGEYARRARAADTQVLLGAIRKLERSMVGLNPAGGSADIVSDIDAVSQALGAAITDIAGLQDGSAGPETSRSTSETVPTTRLGRDLAELAQALQGFAAVLTPDDAESPDPSVLQEAAGELARLSRMQETFCQRTGKLEQTLVQLKARLDALTGTEPRGGASELTPENLSYFGGEEDLFESGSDTAARNTAPAPSLSLVDSGSPGDGPGQLSERAAMAGPADQDKERVVFIRRASSEQASIPLAEEPAEEPADEQPDSRPAHGG